jgi:hypothetical protein
MDRMQVLALIANIAEIVTGVVAAVVGGTYMFRRRQRRLALETYLQSKRLKDEGPGGSGHGLRTVLHLVAHLAMTEEQILEAAFASRKIKRWTAQDPESGRAAALFFQYDKKGGANDDGSY